MARDSSKKSEHRPRRPDGGTDARVTGEPRRRTGTTLLKRAFTDAYSIVVALVMLLAAYWVLFRHVPIGVAGFSVALAVLLLLDLLVTFRTG